MRHGTIDSTFPRTRRDSLCNDIFYCNKNQPFIAIVKFKFKGGRYNKPIPRRIIEQAGIGRGKFATAKAATSLHLFRRKEFMGVMHGSSPFRDYMQWLRMKSRKVSVRLDYFNSDRPSIQNRPALFNHLFPWAMDGVRALCSNGKSLRATDPSPNNS